MGAKSLSLLFYLGCPVLGLAGRPASNSQRTSVAGSGLRDQAWWLGRRFPWRAAGHLRPGDRASVTCLAA